MGWIEDRPLPCWVGTMDAGADSLEKTLMLRKIEGRRRRA